MDSAASGFLNSSEMAKQLTELQAIRNFGPALAAKLMALQAKLAEEAEKERDKKVNPLIHVGNPHRSTPFSDQQYHGFSIDNDWPIR